MDSTIIEFRLNYLPIVLTSFVCFTFIYKFLSPLIANHTTTTYANLSEKHKVEWNTRFTTSIYALVVSTLCLYVLFGDNGLRQSPLLYDSKLVKTNVAIVIGYLISDLIVLIVNYQNLGDKFTLVHHLVSIVGYAYALTYSVMPYFANFRLIAELSSPVLNMRWFLYATGHQKNSLPFVINGLTMTLMFFLVRILTIPIYWYKVNSVMNSHLWAKMGYFRLVMVTTCLILDVINMYWFKKIFLGAKHLVQSNGGHKKIHKTLLPLIRVKYTSAVESLNQFTKTFTSRK